MIGKIKKLLKNEIKILRHLFRKRVYAAPKTRNEIIRQFHRLYYYSYHFGETISSTYWMGKHVRKTPLDCWIYQEILFEVKPDIIIECGTSQGGSALFLASVCDSMNKGRIVTIDVREWPDLPKHDRIKYLLGSSIEPNIISKVKENIKPGEKVLVILDSLHDYEHVLEEMKLYGPMVTLGSYMIVEDSNIGGHPVWSESGPGPMGSIHEYLKDHHDFEIDKSREKFLLTFNPDGYLKKVRASS